MAKSLAQFAADVRGYLARGKLKVARKSFDKAVKVGHKGPQLVELALELKLAEEGGEAAAQALFELARSAEPRLRGAIKSVETHLRKAKGDDRLRDALWEVCLAAGQSETAVRHLSLLVKAGSIDGTQRAQSMLARKDVAGATGIFLLASLGALKTDRIKLADRLLQSERGARLISSACEVLHSQGNEDSEVHYVLAQVAKQRGDKEAFMLHAGKAFDEDPGGIWTNTMADQDSTDRLEFALAKDSLKYLLQAAGEAEADEIVRVARKSKGEGATAKALRGLALLLTHKPPNACRVLESVVTAHGDAAGPLADFLRSKSGEWKGAREVYAAVVGAGPDADGGRISSAITALLEVGEAERQEAWGRVAPRMLELSRENSDLRREHGLHLLVQGDQQAAAALLESEEHLPIAKAWADAGRVGGPVLLAAAELAEKAGCVADHAEWMLNAARGDAAVLAELGAKLSGSVVSVETALQSATALLDRDQKEAAAGVLSRLALDADTGTTVDAMLRERKLLDDRDFRTVSFRAALATGDQQRARRLFPGVSSNVQALAEEASNHAAAGRVLADVLIGQEKGEIGVLVLDKRIEAGDDPRTLIPLADALVKSSPKLSMARLARAKLLNSLGRVADAVRDLRAIPASAPQVGEAFRMLGELGQGDGAGDALLGRADIDIGRKQYADAIAALDDCPADAAQRLQRFETICRAKPDMDTAHRGRALCLLDLHRISEAADAHFKRFSCRDSDPAAIATDLESTAQAGLQANEITTACALLEQLPDRVSDGAERAIAVIGDDHRAPMLILRSKLLLQLGRTEQAVKTLTDLVQADQESRPQAAEALEAIVESGQARPDADFALAEAYEAMQKTPQALATLSRLYDDDLTSKDKVVAAAGKLVVRADDPDVRLFLGRVALDMRDPKGATEHAIQARRLRPAARRDCVRLLQLALDQDAFAPGTHFALAEAHLAGDEADDAVRHFRAAVEVEKGSARAAIAAMEEAAPRSKSPALLWLAVGTTYAEFLKDHARGVRAFSNGLNANPTAEMMVPLLLGRGDSYAALREDNKAFDDFDEASKHDLLERRYYEFLRARHRQRVLEAAETAKAKAGKSFAHAAEACGRFIRLGRHVEAVNVAQEALAAATDEVGPRYLVGVALHAAGRYDAAVQVLEAVRAAAPAGLAVGRAARMLLAESYLDSGDRVKARACLTEIEAVDSRYPGLTTRRAALAPPADDPHAPPPLFVRPEFPRPSE